MIVLLLVSCECERKKIFYPPSSLPPWKGGAKRGKGPPQFRLVPCRSFLATTAVKLVTPTPNHVEPLQCKHLRSNRSNPIHPSHPLRHRMFHLFQNHDVSHRYQRHLRGRRIASHGKLPKAIISNIWNVRGYDVWTRHALGCVDV